MTRQNWMINTDEVKKVASLITPSVGGVGPMTVAMLLSNVIKSYNSSGREGSNSVENADKVVREDLSEADP